MKFSRRQARAIVLQAVVWFALLGAGTSSAELLGIKTNTPPITVSNLKDSSYTYNPTSGVGTFEITDAQVPGPGSSWAFQSASDSTSMRRVTS